jgi:hypothetical protein
MAVCSPQPCPVAGWHTSVECLRDKQRERCRRNRQFAEVDPVTVPAAHSLIKHFERWKVGLPVTEKKRPGDYLDGWGNWHGVHFLF